MMAWHPVSMYKPLLVWNTKQRSYKQQISFQNVVRILKCDLNYTLKYQNYFLILTNDDGDASSSSSGRVGRLPHTHCRPEITTSIVIIPNGRSALVMVIVLDSIEEEEEEWGRRVRRRWLWRKINHWLIYLHVTLLTIVVVVVVVVVVIPVSYRMLLFFHHFYCYFY